MRIALPLESFAVTCCLSSSFSWEWWPRVWWGLLVELCLGQNNTIWITLETSLPGGSDTLMIGSLLGRTSSEFLDGNHLEQLVWFFKALPPHNFCRWPRKTTSFLTLADMKFPTMHSSAGICLCPTKCHMRSGGDYMLLRWLMAGRLSSPWQWADIGRLRF